MDYDHTYWDQVAQQMMQTPHYLTETIGQQKRQVHLVLFQRWLDGHRGGMALKTDLFEEAFGPDLLLSDLSAEYGTVIGMDISPIIVHHARKQMEDGGRQQARFVACDVRRLPFAQSSLSLIVSTSTLDHFSTHKEIEASLAELARCLKNDGLLVITLDNGSNVFYPLLRLLTWLRIGPYHIGPTLSIKGLVSSLEALGLTVTDTAALIHNPRLITTLIAHTLHILFPHQAERWIKALLRLFQRLERWHTRYLTGCFIAARAVKIVEGRGRAGRNQ